MKRTLFLIATILCGALTVFWGLIGIIGQSLSMILILALPPFILFLIAFHHYRKLANPDNSAGFLDLFKAGKNRQLTEELTALQQKYNELEKSAAEQLAACQRKYDALESSMPKEQKEFQTLNQRIETLKSQLFALRTDESKLLARLQGLRADAEKLESDKNSKLAEQTKITADTEKIKRLYEQYKAAVKGYQKDPAAGLPVINPGEELLPLVEVDLNCLNVHDLRNRYNQNQREIQKVFKRYQGRYTTKANIAIYQLMVIAMEAELQNVLATLSHGKLDKAVEQIKAVTQRYYEVAVEGNQSIAPTMQSFIGEIEHLFIETIHVEYEYYVKKEQEREEQRAIREQMRQEAEERKALEAERKKIEKEESKYNTEIEQLSAKMQETSDDDKLRQFQERIAQLQAQIAEVQKKKDEIVNLQNGKAGYVYVISNLGSFGDSVFKIGMTRRLEPMERIKELGSASVPFEFDVHSFIFSDNAVELENTLHKELNQKRVNKVNLRKEFFRVSLDELEQLVLSHDPTAEFKRTMLAEQYHQSLNREEVVMELQDIPSAEDEV